MAIDTLTHHRRPRLQWNEVDMQREELLVRFFKIRETTEWICEPLTTEDCVIQTATECSPVKWQLAHTTWFFETFILLPYAPDYHEFHPIFSYLFNSYYNAMGDRTPRAIRGLMSRPTLTEVSRYRRYVDSAVEKFLGRATEDMLIAAAPIIELGMHHEQQHQELIVTDVKTVLAINPLRPVYRTREILSLPAMPLRWNASEEGLIEIGSQGDSFYFDNECPRHRAHVESFELSDRLITNGEYKAFITDGGYRTSALWLSDGWAKVQEERWLAPKYWEDRDGEWWAMTLQGFRAVEDSEPVTHISHYEADAFATWYGARLPTEFEWELAASDTSVEGNFLEQGNFHPIPMAETQFFGNAWQWTRSAYLPYPGYKPAEGALGEYNGKFMSNQMVLRGGSCVTPQSHIRATYRNFFPPEARWQFSGIRLAKDL